MKFQMNHIFFRRYNTPGARYECCWPHTRSFRSAQVQPGWLLHQINSPVLLLTLKPDRALAFSVRNNSGNLLPRHIPFSPIHSHLSISLVIIYHMGVTTVGQGINVRSKLSIKCHSPDLYPLYLLTPASTSSLIMDLSSSGPITSASEPKVKTHRMTDLIPQALAVKTTEPSGSSSILCVG